jgi:hypothetical protein
MTAAECAVEVQAYLHWQRIQMGLEKPPVGEDWVAAAQDALAAAPEHVAVPDEPDTEAWVPAPPEEDPDA